MQQRLRAEAERSVARELVLEAVADELGIQVSDDELREFLREEAAPGEDAEALIEQVFETRPPGDAPRRPAPAPRARPRRRPR